MAGAKAVSRLQLLSGIYPGSPFLNSPGYYAARDEYYHVGPLDPNVHAQRIIAKWPNASGFVVDPAPPPLYNALLERAPGRVVKARKGEGSACCGV